MEITSYCPTDTLVVILNVLFPLHVLAILIEFSYFFFRLFTLSMVTY